MRWELPVAVVTFFVTCAIFVAMAILGALAWGIWVTMTHFFGEDGGIAAIGGMALFIVVWINIALDWTS